MFDLGYLSGDEYAQARTEKITVSDGHTINGSYDVTYAIDCAVRYFMKLDGFKFRYEFESNEEMQEYQSQYEQEYSIMRDELYKGGYRIYTSIDEEKQAQIQEIANKFVETYATEGREDLQTAIVVADANGLVQAIIGGTGDQTAFGLNRAYQSFRQPGSTIKPLVVYAPALMEDYTPDTVVKNIDVATALKLKKQYAEQGRYLISLQWTARKSPSDTLWNIH